MLCETSKLAHYSHATLMSASEVAGFVVCPHLMFKVAREKDAIYVNPSSAGNLVSQASLKAAQS